MVGRMNGLMGGCIITSLCLLLLMLFIVRLFAQLCIFDFVNVVSLLINKLICKIIF